MTTAGLSRAPAIAAPPSVIVASATIPTRHGPFRFVVFRHGDAGSGSHEDVAMIRGDVTGHDVLVYVHGECLTSEVFASVGCACATDLESALALIAAEGRGVVVYLRQGKFSGPAEITAILRSLGVTSTRMLTGTQALTSHSHSHSHPHSHPQHVAFTPPGALP